MHDDDKIGRAAIGKLTRSKNKTVINPFPECVILMQKFQDVAKHFISNPGNRENYDIILETHKDEVPSTAIERDLNSTRIEARHKLVKSSLRVQKGIQYYSMKFRPIDFPDDNDWKALREVEGVLHT